MGFIRFGLASIVVGGHAGLTADNIGPLMAVQLFFVLSGVYMAAVYTTRYSRLEGGAKLFYVNRVLRLWPTYLLLLALTWLAAMTLGRWVQNDFRLFWLFDKPLSPTQLLALVPANVLVFGQDLLSVDEATHFLLPIRQGWSIATELLFYLLVPLVYGRRFGLFAAPLIALACFAFKLHEMNVAGWRAAYFLPLGNMGYFLFGCFLYHVAEARPVAELRRRLGVLPRVLAPAAILVLAFTCLPNEFESERYLAHFAFLAAFSAVILLAFSEKTHALDTYLGNLSYGVYLNHFLVAALLSAFLSIGRQPGYFVATLVISTLLSMATERVLQRPVDRFRHRLARHPTRSREVPSTAEPVTAAR